MFKAIYDSELKSEIMHEKFNIEMKLMIFTMVLCLLVQMNVFSLTLITHNIRILCTTVLLLQDDTNVSLVMSHWIIWHFHSVSMSPMNIVQTFETSLWELNIPFIAFFHMPIIKKFCARNWEKKHFSFAVEIHKKFKSVNQNHFIKL